MATMDPSEDEISQVIDFANLNPVGDRVMVINALKNNNRNVETVVMQYFDNPESFRQKHLTTWNEAMFSADREGNADNTGISFHIESVNQNDMIQGVTPPPPGYAIGAPSRPPSRSNDRSPLGRMVDWTAADAGTGGAPLRSQEDEDMQRALRESAQEAGITMSLPQESGVTEPSTSRPHFGPANRSDYDQGSWAMVPLGTTVKNSRSTDDPRPSLRKRAAGAPAFLVRGSNSAENHCLGSLLTILHEVPMARNIFLNCGTPAAKYGYNSAWWQGQAIQSSSETLQNPQNEEMQWSQQDDKKSDFEEELHRLMAFLDSTERSYGSVSALTDLVQAASSGPEKYFFEQLGQRNPEVVEPLCQVVTLTSLHREDDPDSEETNFSLLELEHPRADFGNIKTLYEALDHLMWSDALTWNDVGESSKLAMFKQMGEVLIIKCTGDGPEDSFDVPLELYPAKYLIDQKDEARRIQMAWNRTKNAVARILQETKELEAWQNDWKYDEGDKSGMIKKVMDQWKAFRDYLETSGRFQTMEASDFDTNKYSDYRAAPCQMTLDQQRQSRQVDDVLLLAEKVLSDVESRKKSLRTQLEQMQAKQRFLSRLLTDPDKVGRPKPMDCKRYHLRGVAVENDVVYVCQRQERDLIDLEEESKPLDQWWRLAYNANDAHQPVKTEKLEVERVLRDLWRETKTPTLVYATEESLNVLREPLTDPLNLFVRSENRAFRQELSQESARSSEERGRSALESISPSKRKHRSDSPDSMVSNHASLGSDERDGFENPFDDGMESIDMELSDLSNGNKPELVGISDAEEFTGPADLPPPVPPRDIGSYMGTEANSKSFLMLTPETLAAQEAQMATSLAAEVDESIETKTLEMQERGHPLTFAAPAANTTAKALNQEVVDGEKRDIQMPDHRE